MLDGWETAGSHEIRWDGRNAAGFAVKAGIYFIRAESDSRSVRRTLVW
jgi:flagellar hook assembly protein FlgD